MTFGLLSPNKGMEMILQALPEVVRRLPDVLYAIVGQTHPQVKKAEGEAYRERLRDMIRTQSLDRHVAMIDRYLSESELVRTIMACDLYVTPYPGMEQVTSGTLAYAVGLGRPVLSTPYAYARDLLAPIPSCSSRTGMRMPGPEPSSPTCPIPANCGSGSGKSGRSDAR